MQRLKGLIGRSKDAKNSSRLLRTYGDATPHGASWVYEKDGPFRGYVTWSGLAEAVEEVEAVLRARPAPVDALVGFSQGGNLAALVAARAEAGVPGCIAPPRAIVMLETNWATNYEPTGEFGLLSDPERPVSRAGARTAVLIGMADGGVGAPRAQGSRMARAFPSAAVLRYAGPHQAMPGGRKAAAQLCEAIVSFVHCPVQHRWAGGAAERLGDDAEGQDQEEGGGRGGR